jgi:preprotein translocase subunit SecB
VELVHQRFVRADDGPLPSAVTGVAVEVAPEVLVDVDWEVADSGATLGCLVRALTRLPQVGSDADEATARPYTVQCEYRVIYAVASGELAEDGPSQVAYWDATRVVWPYFRADLAAILARADLPQVALPILQTGPVDAAA